MGSIIYGSRDVGMIEITCTSCKRILNVDDAFAGGVCRCQYCGTIQTVAAKGLAQKAAAGAGKGSKTLFENKARSAAVGSGSGLEDLADVVQSSGLSNSDLLKPPSTPPATQGQNLTPVLGLAAVVIVVLLAIVLVLVFRNPATPTPSSAPPNSAVTNNPPAPSPAPAAAAGNFCGIAIDQGVVAYVIDNGASSADVFDTVKSVLLKSIESLGPDRQFQVLFWNPGSDSYPANHTTFAFAVKDNIDVARKKLQGVTAAGATDPLAVLKTVFANDPGQVILVTAKAGDLDDSLVDQVIQLRGNSKVRVDCVAINGVPADKVLAKIAARTGGKFVPLSEAQLKAFSF
jgi:hypothetical protein